MKNIEKLIALQKRNIEFNGWFSDCNEFYYYFGMLDELAEVKHELLNQDSEKLEDEMGDVLWDFLNLVAKLESRGLIDSERMIERSHKKFSERMPYIVEGRFEGDSAERTRLWDEAKIRQKGRKSDINS